MTSPNATVMGMSTAKNNAELIAQCAQLSYLDTTWTTLDCTYGEGRFWRRWHPHTLTACDLDSAKSPLGISVDFTNMPFPDLSFAAVVLDGPYKLNGTSNGTGPATSDADYGVDNRSTVAGRHQLILDGITECNRVLIPAHRVRVDKGRTDRAGGVLLVKCQDQVCCGRAWWQTRIFAEHAETIGLVLEDMLHLPGYRAQPPRTRKHGDCAGRGCARCTDGRVESRQEHAARNYSTLLVFRKPQR